MIYAEKKRHFRNREQAGKELGMLLETKYRGTDPLIFGIPRGGVEVAYHVATKFHTVLQIIVSKKLPHPQQPEFGIGAVSEEGTIYVSPRAEKMLYPDILEEIIEEQLLEVQRRVKIYRNGKPLPAMAGRDIIIVDDGIATGVTLVPVIKLCRRKHAANIIIAAPVSGLSFNEGLYQADAIEVLIQPASFYAVGQVYENFEEFDDIQLMRLMRKANSD